MRLASLLRDTSPLGRNALRVAGPELEIDMRDSHGCITPSNLQPRIDQTGSGL